MINSDPQCVSALALKCLDVVCSSVVQCVAVCCSVFQCVAVCCSVLQHVSSMSIRVSPFVSRCCVLQCVAACCSVLQCVAACVLNAYQC